MTPRPSEFGAEPWRPSGHLFSGGYRQLWQALNWVGRFSSLDRATMNARSACLDALTAWESEGAFADEVLHRELERGHAAAPDRALLTELFYGVIRHLGRLDFLVDQLAERALDERTRRLLRLGVYQIFDTRIPPHAAVHETVELAGRSRSLVNALLRRCLREKEALAARVAAANLAIRRSHPAHLIERWERTFGESDTEMLTSWNNSPAPIYVTANALKVTPGELRQSSPAAKETEHEYSLRVAQIPFLWIANGLCYVQDPSTLIAPLLLDPQPGERVLDACAAPGGKAAFMAGLMRDTGELIACDASSARLVRLRQNLERLGVTCAPVRQVDWEQSAGDFAAGSFDRILVDAPCTNTGVIRRRIDVKWRLHPEEFAKLAERQLAIIRRVIPLLRSGGRLVYSTCSLEPEENEGVAGQIATEFSDLDLVETRQSLPFRDGIDGGFAALLVRR